MTSEFEEYKIKIEALKKRLRPRVVLPMDNLSPQILREIIMTYQNMFKRGPTNDDNLEHDIRCIIEDLEETGFSEIRYGAVMPEWTNTNAKLKAKKQTLYRSEDGSFPGEDAGIPCVTFYFNPNLDSFYPYEDGAEELSEQLAEDFLNNVCAIFAESETGIVLEEDDVW